MTEDELREEYQKAMDKSSAEALKVLKEIVKVICICLYLIKQERPDSPNAADALIVHLLEADQVDEAIVCNLIQI